MTMRIFWQDGGVSGERKSEVDTPIVGFDISQNLPEYSGYIASVELVDNQPRTISGRIFSQS